MPVTDPSPVEPSKATDRLAPKSADSEKDPEAPEQKREMEAELDAFLRPS